MGGPVAGLPPTAPHFTASRRGCRTVGAPVRPLSWQDTSHSPHFTGTRGGAPAPSFLQGRPPRTPCPALSLDRGPSRRAQAQREQAAA